MIRPSLLCLLLVAAGCQLQTPLPQGDLFAAPLADPKEPRFAMSLRTVRPEGDDNLTVGAASFGETFGLYRHALGRGALQVDLAAGIFSLFDIDGYSNGLVNADYQIGLPVTLRSGPWSARARIYHQSSHLGDEYILVNRLRERINHNFDALELTVARDLGPARGYLGTAYLFGREPEELEPHSIHAGADYRSREPVIGSARLVAGIDLQSREEQHWNATLSAVAGLELESRMLDGRRVRLLVEALQGFNPYGQFYNQEIAYLGVGLAFAF